MNLLIHFWYSIRINMPWDILAKFANDSSAIENYLKFGCITMAVKDVIQNDSINQNWNKMKYNGMTNFKK